MLEFEIGDHVKVRYFEDRKWYPARIVGGPSEAGWFKVRWDGAIFFEGRIIDEWVEPREMRFIKHGLQP